MAVSYTHLENNIIHTIKNVDIKNYHFDDLFQYFDYKNLKNIKINLRGKMCIRDS